MAIGEGNLTIEIEAQNRDEIGELGSALAVMRNMLSSRSRDIEIQDWLNTGKNELSAIMRQEEDLLELCRKLLTFLAKHIDAQVGALYLNQQDELRLTASYAYKSRNNDLVFKLGEGLVGQAALDKELIIFNNLPKEHLDLKVNSGLGESTPVTIIALPLLNGAQLTGVIEIAVANKLRQEHVQFLEQVAESIAISIASTMNVIRTQKLLQQTQEQSGKLANQQEELRVSNEEMQKQTNKLRESGGQLQAQEELRVSMEELEESSRSLQSQNDDFENKNRELGLIRDELLLKQQELEKSSRYKSEFLANMSHELRTPLNSILILSRLLMDKDDGPLTDRERSFGSTIHQSGEDLLQLINDILDLSKVEAGHLDLILEEVKFEDCCANMQRNFGALATQKGLTFDVTCQAQCPASFTCDSQRLEQILKNFLSNAFKFTKHGTVSLSIGPADEDLTTPENTVIPAAELISFKVSDSGKGIPTDMLNMIFQAFRQEDGSISRKFGGTGLGLAISKKLATLLGGDILVTSNLDQGSCFNLVIPLNQAAAMPASTKTATQELSINRLPDVSEPARPIDSEELSLLVIDADESFNTRLSKHAEKCGFNVISVANAQDAPILAEQLPPRAIIIDVDLPQAKGWDIIKQLQQSCPAAKIWVISKCGEIVDSSIDGFYNKPLNDHEIDKSLARIKTVLSGQGLKLLIGGQALGTQFSDLAHRVGFKTHVAKDFDQIRQELTQLYHGLMIDINFDGKTCLEVLKQLKSEDLQLPELLICTALEISPDLEKELHDLKATIIIMSGNRYPKSKSTARLQDELQLLSARSLNPSPKKAAEKASKEEHLTGKKILLVDDDSHNVFSLSQALESHGLQVEVACNGLEALEQIKKHNFDLVLMDVMMPEMDGLECTRKIRLQSRLKNLPILAVTAKAMKGDRDKCLEAGVDDYITKPVELPRLMELLRLWIK